MEQPNFFAILPAAVRYDKRLKAAEKIFYAEITSLADKTGYCYASNAYFMQVYGVAERTVQEWVKSLTKCGYITVEIMSKSGDSRCERRISPVFGLDALKNTPAEICTTPAEICTTPAEICGGTPADFCASPPQKSAPRIIQDNNNTRVNNTRAKKSPLDVFAEFAKDDNDLRIALEDFDELRRTIKRPLTTRAAMMICNKLCKLAQDAGVHNKRGYMVAVLNQSIQAGWWGVFELKDRFVDGFPAGRTFCTEDRPRDIKPGDDITQYL